MRWIPLTYFLILIQSCIPQLVIAYYPVYILLYFVYFCFITHEQGLFCPCSCVILVCRLLSRIITLSKGGRFSLFLRYLNEVKIGTVSSVSIWWLHHWSHLDSQKKKQRKISNQSYRKNGKQRSSGGQNYGFNCRKWWTVSLPKITLYPLLKFCHFAQYPSFRENKYDHTCLDQMTAFWPRVRSRRLVIEIGIPKRNILKDGNYREKWMKETKRMGKIVDVCCNNQWVYNLLLR